VKYIDHVLRAESFALNQRSLRDARGVSSQQKQVRFVAGDRLIRRVGVGCATDVKAAAAAAAKAAAAALSCVIGGGSEQRR